MTPSRPGSPLTAYAPPTCCRLPASVPPSVEASLGQLREAVKVLNVLHRQTKLLAGGLRGVRLRLVQSGHPYAQEPHGPGRVKRPQQVRRHAPDRVEVAHGTLERAGAGEGRPVVVADLDPDGSPSALLAFERLAQLG